MPDQLATVKTDATPAPRRPRGKPTLILVSILTALSLAGFVLMYLRLEGLKSQISEQKEFLKDNFGDALTRINSLLDADKLRDETVAALKKKQAETGDLLIKDGQLLMDRGESLKQAAGLIKASEAARSDKTLVNKGDTLMQEGANLVQEGNALKQTGTELKEAAAK